MSEWMMLLRHEGRLVPFYGVKAEGPEEARLRIVAELGRKPHRASAVERWLADGQPVVQVGVRGKVARVASTSGPAGLGA